MIGPTLSGLVGHPISPGTWGALLLSALFFGHYFWLRKTDHPLMRAARARHLASARAPGRGQTLRTMSRQQRRHLDRQRQELLALGLVSADASYEQLLSASTRLTSQRDAAMAARARGAPPAQAVAPGGLAGPDRAAGPLGAFDPAEDVVLLSDEDDEDGLGDEVTDGGVLESGDRDVRADAARRRAREERARRRARFQDSVYDASVVIAATGQDSIAVADRARYLAHIRRLVAQGQGVILVEAAAAQLGLGTPVLVDFLTELARSAELPGIFDNRGRFIHLPPELLGAVRDSMAAQGRVSIQALRQGISQAVAHAAVPLSQAPESPGAGTPDSASLQASLLHVLRNQPAPS
ncbi:hypothetical protein H696_01927 [Fonticula alba]|uniref:Uncharacterized protein n=1 Tax=Fonticula alba TaxID=691883 RepID=A0A058Z9S5_FONAL|nr:hypothetical protein H696_01927 [Fonticula alba]KCV70980.1 hypothetical protein H696_01927 [Fonticula alba]|eukprot:XP_009494103.1 hypothetical protein H696_01927 [Fonticula alba]